MKNAVTSLEGVAEVAAHAAPAGAERTEDEVMLAVVLRDGVLKDTAAGPPRKKPAQTEPASSGKRRDVESVGSIGGGTKRHPQLSN